MTISRSLDRFRHSVIAIPAVIMFRVTAVAAML